MAWEFIKNVQIRESFPIPRKLTKAEQEKDEALFDKAYDLIKEHNIFLIAHYYTSHAMQKLAEKTGGFIGDSLEMARAGRDSDKNTILVSGVRFMGETAKILSPNKKIIMPNLKAECSLDLCCEVEDLKKVRELYKDYTIVAYANTSAKVKALSDFIVTSSLAVDLAKYLHNRGDKILWLPDRHLGSYIAKNIDADDMLIWPGRCIVHDAFEANALSLLKKEHPNAKVLVHPEAPWDVVKMADHVGSTSQILAYAKQSDAKEFIIATEKNIFYKILKACPDKTLIEAPVLAKDGHCISCANCPWMELNTMQSLIDAILDSTGHEVFVDEDTRVDALRPLEKMLTFSSYLKQGGEIPKDL